jgi:tryptophanyl-tRNA synthetase
LLSGLAMLPTACGCRTSGPRSSSTEAVNERLAPIRARRAALAGDLGHVRQVLHAGNARAGAIADATLAEVRRATGMSY